MISIEFEKNKSQCLSCLKKDKNIYELRIRLLLLSLCLDCLNEVKQKVESIQKFQNQTRKLYKDEL